MIFFVGQTAFWNTAITFKTFLVPIFYLEKGKHLYKKWRENCKYKARNNCKSNNQWQISSGLFTWHHLISRNTNYSHDRFMEYQPNAVYWANFLYLDHLSHFCFVQCRHIMLIVTLSSTHEFIEISLFNFFHFQLFLAL